MLLITGRKKGFNVGCISVLGNFFGTHLLRIVCLFSVQTKEMRITELPMFPVEWAHKTKAITQDQLVHKLYLHNQTVRRVSYWRERSDGNIYIDIQMGPLDNIGTWHSYWTCFRFEWMRSLDSIRELYQNAASTHERMRQEFDEELRLVSMNWRPPKKITDVVVNWKEDGF